MSYTAYTMNGKYLSVNRDYLNLTEDKTLSVNGMVFDLALLRMNVTYNEHKDFVRYNRKDYMKCRV